MSFTIREAKLEDRPALLEQCWQLNLYEDPVSHDRRIDLEGAKETLRAALERVAHSGGTTLVAEHEGRVVAHLFLTFEMNASYVREEHRVYAYVHELYVRESARRLGIGRALIAEAERIALAQGVTRLGIGVLAGNTMAERAYLGYGFRPYATELVKPLKR